MRHSDSVSSIYPWTEINLKKIPLRNRNVLDRWSVRFHDCRFFSFLSLWICTRICWQKCQSPLQWRHNERDGASKHRRLDCLLNRSFRRRSEKTSKLRVTGLCEGNSPVAGEFPAHKGPITRKTFPFDDVIMVDKRVSYLWKCNARLRQFAFNICVSSGTNNRLIDKIRLLSEYGMDKRSHPRKTVGCNYSSTP